MSRISYHESSVMLLIIILTLQGALQYATGAGTLTDVSYAVGLSNVDGVLASFCDFDSDKDTDILIISSSGKSLDIYLWMSPIQKFSKSNKGLTFSDNVLVVGAAHSDFDGDGCPDILLITKNSTSQNDVDVYIFWSVNEKLDHKHKTYIGRMPDQPLIIDVNGDILPDLFGIDSNSGQKAVWVSVSGLKNLYSRKFKMELFGNDSLPAAFPLSSAFADLTGDLHSDLIMPVYEKNRTVFEVWPTKSGIFGSKSDLIKIELPPELQKMKLGQASYGDLDADGKIDIILPACSKPACILSYIYIYSKGVWSRLLATDQGQSTRFPDGDFKLSDLLNFPPVIRIGDFNMDGYPDAVAVFEGKKNRRISYLLENVACKDKPETMCTSSRALSIKKEISLEENAALVVFLDIYENGILDFLVVTSTQKGYKIKAYRNDFNTDTTFLKILVLSGRCYKSCICKKIETPYGSDQVGAVAVYKTTSPEGNLQTCAAVQLSKSSHFSLQLPYTLFGLGRTPNFVEHLRVGIPQGSGKVDRVRSWQSLIPNSQVIVIPFPPDKPSEWMTKLLVTPSKLLLQIGGVLIGTCVFVAGLILMFYIKEKREDEKEKREEAHKFHFDAL